jgi:hypothetical protein
MTSEERINVPTGVVIVARKGCCRATGVGCGGTGFGIMLIQGAGRLQEDVALLGRYNWDVEEIASDELVAGGGGAKE